MAFGKMTEPAGVDLLKTIAAIAGGPVGIVVGFYFSSPTQPGTGPTPPGSGAPALTAPGQPSVSPPTLAAGQELTVTGMTPTTGTPPYKWQFLMAANGGGYAPPPQGTVKGTEPSAGQTVTCKIPGGTLTSGKSYTFELQVTDSATPPATQTSAASPPVKVT